ncbi:hypothetical protein [Paenirhodobacter sp.]|uniref:hypothetical protein n=1 Tax=Paenirhodobacter sp. TaxID=1965326 RepID=UPI003B50385C
MGEAFTGVALVISVALIGMFFGIGLVIGGRIGWQIYSFVDDLFSLGARWLVRRCRKQTY